MMNELTAFDSITMVSDGDQIATTLFATLPLKQYLKLGTDYVYPSWKEVGEQPVIYPRIQSQNAGTRLSPVTGSEKWYYSDTEIKFDSAGLSLDKKFKKETYKDGAVTVPSLRIVSNLASLDNIKPDKIDLVARVKIGVSEAIISPSIPVSLEEVAGDPFDSFISATNGGVIDNTTDSIVSTAYLRKGGQKVTEGITYKWYKDTVSGYSPINPDAGKPNTKTIKDDDIDSSLVLKCEFIVDGKVVSIATTQLFDETDPLIINTRPSGPKQLTVGGHVTFTPQVVRRDKGIPIPGFSFKYLIRDIDSTLVREATGESIKITSQDVVTCKGNVALHTYAEKK